MNFSNKLSPKRIFSLFAAAVMTFSATACTENFENTDFPVADNFDNYLPNKEEVQLRVLTDKSQNEVNLTVWSWQVPSAEYAEKYAEEAKKLGFDGIDFVVQWKKFEAVQGEFDWKYLDSILDVFVKHDLGISISVLFWTEGLEWRDELDFQMTSDGKIYAYDDMRSHFLALNSEKNIAVMENTLKYFAAHCDGKYKENITRWYIRTSVYAEMEYSSLVDLDYSPSAISAFKKFLQEKYAACAVFNKHYGYSVESWEELANMDGVELAKTCLYDWKLFKQKTIIDISNMYTKIFKIANPDIPVSLQLSSIWDTSASFYRGVFDPYVIATESKVDIIQISDSPVWPHDFSIDLLASFTSGQYIAMETDGSWRGESAFDDYVKQVSDSVSSGASYINAVNWEYEDLLLYGEKYLSQYKSSADSAKNRSIHDVTDVILINTRDFLLRTPPQDMHDLYYYAYRNMSSWGSKKVRFITDTQILADPTILNSITKIHVGELADVIVMSDEVGKLLAESSITLVDDLNAQPNFINEYGEPLQEEVQVALRAKLKDS
ncbi:MAG: beta-galactosidase [Clostridia bacterium]|nr:beta-galactosidase [Clostridia bacterium]